jgi:hypothetical protein
VIYFYRNKKGRTEMLKDDLRNSTDKIKEKYNKEKDIIIKKLTKCAESGDELLIIENFSKLYPFLQSRINDFKKWLDNEGLDYDEYATGIKEDWSDRIDYFEIRW